MQVKMLVMPAFKSQDEFYRGFLKLVWQLNPYVNDIGCLQVLYEGSDMADLDLQTFFSDPKPFLPKDFAEDIIPLVKNFRKKLIIVPDETGLIAETIDERFDAIYCWNLSRPVGCDHARKIAGKAGTRMLPMDSAITRPESVVLAIEMEEIIKLPLNDMIFKSRQIFGAFADRYKGEPVNIYGAGPSIDRLFDEDRYPKDGITFICNNGVANKRLLERTKPVLIAVGDPVYYPGFSRHAGEFRKHLITAMETYGSYLVCDSYVSLYFMQSLPSHLRDKIIGVPCYPSDVNLDMVDRFQTPTGKTNILTMSLLSLGTTVSKDIRLMGFDGRPFGQSGKFFWGYSKASVQKDQVMDSLYTCSPAYFYRYDTNAFVAALNKEIELFLRPAEAKGIRVTCLTPSYMPSLARRFGTADYARGTSHVG